MTSVVLRKELLMHGGASFERNRILEDVQRGLLTTTCYPSVDDYRSMAEGVHDGFVSTT